MADPAAHDRDGGQQRAYQAEQGIPVELADAVKEPCNECPWRRVAIPGYLGPESAENWIQAIHGEHPIMCHKTCNPGGSYDGTMQCRGAAIMRANTGKKPRRSDIVTGPVDKERVFGSNEEFIDHHTKGGSDGDDVPE